MYFLLRNCLIGFKTNLFIFQIYLPLFQVKAMRKVAYNIQKYDKYKAAS